MWYSIDFHLLLTVTSVEVLQASVYGIGVCAEFGGAAFKPLVGGGQLNFKALYVSFVKLSQLKCSVVLGRWWEVQATSICISDILISLQSMILICLGKLKIPSESVASFWLSLQLLCKGLMPQSVNPTHELQTILWPLIMQFQPLARSVNTKEIA